MNVAPVLHVDTRMSRARVELGELGEDLACEELVRRGYAILARRYRCRGGELDIIARHRGALVFVEVKTRRDARFGGGVGAMTALKRRRMVRLAHDYLARHGAAESACRFDVVSIMLDGAQPMIEVFENAFGVD